MADNQLQKLHRESQVSLLDRSLRLGHPVSTLSINGQVQGYPPLGGLSQRWLMKELAIFDNLPALVKLGGERGLVGINILRRMDTGGWQVGRYQPECHVL